MNGLFLTQLDVQTLWKKSKLILWGLQPPSITILFKFITDASELENSTDNSVNLNKYIAMNNTLATTSKVP